MAGVLPSHLRPVLSALRSLRLPWSAEQVRSSPKHHGASAGFSLWSLCLPNSKLYSRDSPSCYADVGLATGSALPQLGFHGLCVPHWLVTFLRRVRSAVTVALKATSTMVWGCAVHADAVLASCDLFSASFFACSFTLPTRVPVRPAARFPKILALDLDETLIYASARPLPEYDYLVHSHTGMCFFVLERPYLRHFLLQVCRWYHVVIFTAGTRVYADPIICRLDPQKQVFRKRYFREFCQKKADGSYVKDLTSITKSSSCTLANCILVDNSPSSFAANPFNAIPIPTFTAKPSQIQRDTALLGLLPMLHALQHTQDVRSVLMLRTRSPA
eukprot:RCo050937